MKKKPFFSSFPQIGIALSEVLKNQLSVFLSKSFLLLHRKGVTKRGDLADFWIQLKWPLPLLRTVWKWSIWNGLQLLVWFIGFGDLKSKLYSST